jgi:hypothetical protein
MTLPDGGAHIDHAEAAGLIDRAITHALDEILGLTAEERIRKLNERFRAI